MRVFKRLIIICFVLLILCSSTFVAYLYKSGDRVLSVQTGSMVPTFKVGDAVIVQRKGLKNLHEGDIISYRSPANKSVIVTHRLVRVDYITGRLVTKGDALERVDLPFPASRLIGVVYKVVPRVGGTLDWLHSPTGLILAVYAPAVGVILYELKRLSAQYEHVQRTYKLHGYR